MGFLQTDNMVPSDKLARKLDLPLHFLKPGTAKEPMGVPCRSFEAGHGYRGSWGKSAKGRTQSDLQVSATTQGI